MKLRVFRTRDTRDTHEQQRFNTRQRRLPRICSVVGLHDGDVPVTGSPTDCRTAGTNLENTLKKAKLSTGDPHLAFLALRATPVDNVLPFSSELLKQRKIKTTIPTKIHDRIPIRDTVKSQLYHRQHVQKHSYDQRAGPGLNHCLQYLQALHKPATPCDDVIIVVLTFGVQCTSCIASIQSLP